MQKHEHFLMVRELDSQMLLLFWLFSNRGKIEAKNKMVGKKAK